MATEKRLIDANGWYAMDIQKTRRNPLDAVTGTAKGGEQMKIDELELSVRTYNCLKRVGIDTVEKLLTMSDADLMRIRCFGVKCLNEVHEKNQETL